MKQTHDIKYLKQTHDMTYYKTHDIKYIYRQTWQLYFLFIKLFSVHHNCLQGFFNLNFKERKKFFILVWNVENTSVCSVTKYAPSVNKNNVCVFKSSQITWLNFVGQLHHLIGRWENSRIIFYGKWFSRLKQGPPPLRRSGGDHWRSKLTQSDTI